MFSASSKGRAERCGSSMNLRNSCTFNPKLCPPNCTTPNGPPARDGREPLERRSARDRALLEHDRRSRLPPNEAIRRNRTLRVADIFADGEMEIVPLQARAGIPLGLPELCKTRIDIDVHAPSHAL